MGIANMKRYGSFQTRFDARFNSAAVNSATEFTGRFMGTKYRGLDVIAIGPTLNAFGYKAGGRYCPIECPFSCKWENNKDPIIAKLQQKKTFEGDDSPQCKKAEELVSVMINTLKKIGPLEGVYDGE